MLIGSKPESLSVLGVRVSVFQSYNHAVEYIVARINEGKKTFSLAVNPEKVYNSLFDPKLNRLLNSADMQICDGVGITYATRLLLKKTLARITGVQLFFELISRAETDGLKVFLLGTSPESSKQAHVNLLKTHPALKITGRQHGFFKDDLAVIQKINESRADMLFVAMGSPKQEQWIAKHRDRIEVPFCMGVGGTFDVVSGHAKWAPKIFRILGMEFLYRLIREPRRWRRQLVLPKFALAVLRAELFGVRLASTQPPAPPFPAIKVSAMGDVVAQRSDRLPDSPEWNDRRDAA